MHEDELDDDVEEFEIIEEEEDGGDEAFGAAEFVSGLVIGVAAGAMVALLFAPQAGVRTRRKLGRRARHLRDQAEDRLHDSSRDLRKQVRRGRRKIKGKIDRATKRTKKVVKRLT